MSLDGADTLVRLRFGEFPGEPVPVSELVHEVNLVTDNNFWIEQNRRNYVFPFYMDQYIGHYMTLANKYELMGLQQVERYLLDHEEFNLSWDWLPRTSCQKTAYIKVEPQSSKGLGRRSHKEQEDDFYAVDTRTDREIESEPSTTIFNPPGYQDTQVGSGGLGTTSVQLGSAGPVDYDHRGGPAQHGGYQPLMDFRGNPVYEGFKAPLDPRGRNAPQTTRKRAAESEEETEEERRRRKEMEKKRKAEDAKYQKKKQEDKRYDQNRRGRTK